MSLILLVVLWLVGGDPLGAYGLYLRWTPGQEIETYACNQKRSPAPEAEVDLPG